MYTSQVYTCKPRMHVCDSFPSLHVCVCVCSASQTCSCAYTVNVRFLELWNYMTNFSWAMRLLFVNNLPLSLLEVHAHVTSYSSFLTHLLQIQRVYVSSPEVNIHMRGIFRAWTLFFTNSCFEHAMRRYLSFVASFWWLSAFFFVNVCVFLS